MYNDQLIKDILDMHDNIMYNTIKKLGGDGPAKRILKNAPNWANAYDMMYNKYIVSDAFFHDHNMVVMLNHLDEYFHGY